MLVRIFFSDNIESLKYEKILLTKFFPSCRLLVRILNYVLGRITVSGLEGDRHATWLFEEPSEYGVSMHCLYS